MGIEPAKPLFAFSLELPHISTKNNESRTILLPRHRTQPGRRVCTFCPLTTARILGVAAVPATNFVTRLFGCRDLVLGGRVLATATAPTEQRRIVLLAANIFNAIDVFSGLVCYAEGNLTKKALILGSGGATLAFTLGMFEASAL